MLRESQEEMASHVAADRARALPTAMASISLMEEDPVVDLTESNRTNRHQGKDTRNSLKRLS